jgi:predicted dehydrogenase
VQRSETLMTASDDKGAVWRLSTAWTFPQESCPPDRIEVIGERGSVEMEVGGAIHVYGAAPRQIDVSGADPDQPLRSELAYFVECIHAGREPTVVTLADAVAGLRTADAAIASLTSGETVRP